MGRETDRREDQSPAGVAERSLHEPAMNSSKSLEVTYTEEASSREGKVSLGAHSRESLTETLRRRPIPLWGRGSLQLYATCLLVYLCSTMNGQAFRAMSFPKQTC